MGLLEFGLGKPIRMDIRPGFLKGIPVEVFLADKMATHRGWNVGRRGFLFNVLRVHAGTRRTTG